MIIKKTAITNTMLHDMDMLIRCTNLEVYNFCKAYNLDIHSFTDLIEIES